MSCKRWALGLSLFPLVAMTADPALAATYYVATNGNDDNSGALAAPFRTLAKAVRAVEPGDTIELREGTYAGGIIVSRAGTPDAWITLRPYKKEKAVIDGEGKPVAVYFYNDNFSPVYWIMQGLEVKGGGYTVKIDTPRVKLLNNNLHGASEDIVKIVKTADEVTVSGNEIHHNNARNGANAQGVDIMGANNVLVADNYVHDIPSIALYAKGNASHTVFENNRVENIYARGIMLGQNSGRQFLDPNKPYESYDGIIRNNVIKNTRGACLATASSLNVKIYNNTCYNVASEFNGAIFVSNESELGQAGTNVEIKNNIIVANGNRPMVHVAVNAMTDDATLNIDGNVYWTAKGPEAVTFSWDRGAGESKPSTPSFWAVKFDKWKRMTGKDVSSVIADPGQGKFNTKAGAQLSCSGAACGDRFAVRPR